MCALAKALPPAQHLGDSAPQQELFQVHKTQQQTWGAHAGALCSGFPGPQQEKLWEPGQMHRVDLLDPFDM